MEEARGIDTAGNHELKGVDTEIIGGYITDHIGVRQQVRLPIGVVPGIGRTLFLVPSAKDQGVETMFAVEGLWIETDDFTICYSE